MGNAVCTIELRPNTALPLARSASLRAQLKVTVSRYLSTMRDSFKVMIVVHEVCLLMLPGYLG